ncbi:Transcriptional regulatory protein ros [Methylobacterium tardum]|jgi:predicted transcriptional regulator|uniref:MucR family transcriptional regulator n=1 Tax=Methylobacterium tardum TaxID=374432 RepID=A0AA37WUQ1_9HYPH|nr:MucR family transcriptional regulator [Methylobacterium tardum]URD36869.1 MucR family transcriptional regulator [Methylobacterium tardum]GJE47305.1 Transcriptional regulatory protein ros [Methylobacterium tardum]GLS71323.1 MucR family transcriptional regulator [Methylobacterium tardum]
MRNQERRAPAGAIDTSCRIVSAYVAANAVPASRLPDLIVEVHAALASRWPIVAAGRPSSGVESPLGGRPTLAQVRASLGPGGIKSFETGKRYTSLKRHLGSLGLTPDAYRRKWGLPPDYPMVCPAYSALRADIAKSIGLGKRYA